MKKRILTIILSAAMLLGAFSLSACTNTELEAKIADLQAQISEQQAQIEELEGENKDLKQQINDLESQIDSSNSNNIEFSTEWVFVDVKEKYKEAFINEEFTIEDFCWDNIERIEYGSWSEKTTPEKGSIKVYLIKPGEAQALNAVNYFNTLDFVYTAWLDYVIHLA